MNLFIALALTAALVLFLLASYGQTSRLNLMALGLAALTLAFLIPAVNDIAGR